MAHVATIWGPAMGRFPTWTKFLVVAAAVLLSPVLAFFMAIAVEISIGAVEDAGALPLLALVVAGAIGCSLIRKAGARLWCKRSDRNEIRL
jgi:hypothetical protein